MIRVRAFDLIEHTLEEREKPGRFPEAGAGEAAGPRGGAAPLTPACRAAPQRSSPRPLLLDRARGHPRPPAPAAAAGNVAVGSARGGLVLRARPFRQTQSRQRGGFEISPFNFPQQPQQNHMARLRQSPWCVRCYFGRKSEWLLYKFHLMPARPSVSEAAAPSLPAKPRSPGRGRGNLINLQNACDLLIYYYNRSSAHDTFPALGASTAWFQQFLASAPDRLQGL